MSVNKLDKYYTPQWLVKKQIKKTIEIIGMENISDVIEPSAGDGAYIKSLQSTFKGKDIYYYDLYPEHPQIKQQDFLKLRKSYHKGRLFIGNPPYGTASNLWRAFCRKSSQMGDYISFISPASQYNSNYYFPQGELVYSELLNDVEYLGSKTEGGKNQKVRTCLNIYKCYDRDNGDIREELVKNKVKFGRTYSNSNICNLKEFEYYICHGTNGPKWGTLVKPGEYQLIYGVTVLDEDVRDEVIDFLNNFYKYKDELKSLKSSMPVIDNGFFLNKLKKHLYPTRDERLEQDIHLADVRKHSDGYNRTGYDYYISQMFGVCHTEPKEVAYHGIKVVNEDIRGSVEKFIETFEEKFGDELYSLSEGNRRVVRNNWLKDVLKKHLYPTRDERLEQDVLIMYKNISRDGEYKNGDYWLTSFRDNIKVYNECPKDGVAWVFKAKNISKDILYKALIELKNTYDYQYGITIQKELLKNILKKHLYPKDDSTIYTPSWEEEYELKKAIKVERILYAKELF